MFQFPNQTSHLICEHHHINGLVKKENLTQLWVFITKKNIGIHMRTYVYRYTHSFRLVIQIPLISDLCLVTYLCTFIAIFPDDNMYLLTSGGVRIGGLMSILLINTNPLTY